MTELDAAASTGDAPVIEPPAGVMASREAATSFITTGGAAGILGAVGIYLGALSTGSPGLLGVLAGAGLLGVGLVQLGRAALHLKRYGSDRGALILGSLSGVGLSVLAWGLSVLPEVLGLGPALTGLNYGAVIGIAGFSLFIVLLTLSALVRWLLGSRDGG